MAKGHPLAEAREPLARAGERLRVGVQPEEPRARASRGADGGTKEFRAVVRIDTPQEVLYYQHGGILQYVLRQLLNQKT